MFREKLAELAHSQWSGWMGYLFSKCIDYKPDSVQAEEGAVIMPKWAVDRWKRQAETAYIDLTTEEMDSDRAEADKFLAVFESQLATVTQELADVKAERDRYKGALEKIVGNECCYDYNCTDYDCCCEWKVANAALTPRVTPAETLEEGTGTNTC